MVRKIKLKRKGKFMRQVTILKDEFDDLFYPSLTSTPAENEVELEVSMRLMKKLRDPSKTHVEVISPERKEQVRKSGGKVVPSRFLLKDMDVFHLEEDEYNLALNRMKKTIPMFTSAVAPELYDFIEKFKGASHMTFNQVEETRESLDR